MMEIFVAVAVALQLVSLAYDPRRQIPGARDREAGDQLVHNLSQLAGPLLLPCHDYLTERAGKAEHFHEMSLMAVLKSGDDTTAVRMSRQLAEALRERQWPWIVLDTRDWLWETVALNYEPQVEAIPADDVCLARDRNAAPPRGGVHSARGPAAAERVTKIPGFRVRHAGDPDAPSTGHSRVLTFPARAVPLEQR